MRISDVPVGSDETTSRDAGNCQRGILDDAGVTQPDSGDGRRTAVNDLFADFFREHWAGVHRFAVRRLGPRLSAADDVCAEVFVVALKRFETDRLWDVAPSVARGWLIRVAWHKTLKEHGSATRWLRLSDRVQGATGEAYDPFDDVFIEVLSDGGQLAARAHAVIADLSEAHRRVLTLELDGPFSGKQLAEKLGTTDQGARLRLMRARREFAVVYLERFGWPWGDEGGEP